MVAKSYNIDKTKPTSNDKLTWTQENFLTGMVSIGSVANAYPSQVKSLVNFNISKDGVLEKRKGTKLLTSSSLTTQTTTNDGSVIIFDAVEKDNILVSFYLSNGVIFNGISNNKVPYFRYVEMNDIQGVDDGSGVFSYDSPGSYNKQDPTSEDYISLEGEGNTFQMYDGKIYWLIGNTMFIYPYNGSWRTNEDGSIYIDYYTGLPKIIENEEAENKVWIELPVYQPKSNEFQEVGSNLFSSNPRDRILKFIPNLVKGIDNVSAYSVFDASRDPGVTDTVETYSIISDKFVEVVSETEITLAQTDTRHDPYMYTSSVEPIFNNISLGESKIDFKNYGTDNTTKGTGSNDRAHVRITMNPLSFVPYYDASMRGEINEDEFISVGTRVGTHWAGKAYNFNTENVGSTAHYFSYEYPETGMSEALNINQLDSENDFFSFNQDAWDSSIFLKFPYNVNEHYIIEEVTDFFNLFPSNENITIDVNTSITSRFGDGSISDFSQNVSLNRYQEAFLDKYDEIIDNYLENPLMKSFVFYMYSLTSPSFFLKPGRVLDDPYIRFNHFYTDPDRDAYLFASKRLGKNEDAYLIDNTVKSRDRTGDFEFNMSKFQLPKIEIYSSDLAEKRIILDPSVNDFNYLNPSFSMNSFDDGGVDLNPIITDGSYNFSNLITFFKDWENDDFTTYVVGYDGEETAIEWPEDFYTKLANLKEVVTAINNGDYSVVSTTDFKFVYDIINFKKNDDKTITYNIRVRFTGAIYYLETPVTTGVDDDMSLISIYPNKNPIEAGDAVTYSLTISAQDFSDVEEAYYQWKVYQLEDITTDTIIEPDLDGGWDIGYDETTGQKGYEFSYISVTPNDPFVIYAFAITSEQFNNLPDTVDELEYIEINEQFNSTSNILLEENFDKTLKDPDKYPLKGFHISDNRMFLYSKDHIWVSSLFNFSYFPSSQLLVLGDQTTEVEIQAFSYAQTTLIILTNKNIYTLTYSYDVDGYVLNQINANYGTIAPKSVFPFENGVVFLTNQGIFQLTNLSESSKDNLNISRLDFYIKDQIESLSTEVKKNAQATLWQNKYIISFPYYDGTRSKWFIYDSDFSNWVQWEGLYLDTEKLYEKNGELYYTRKSRPEILKYGYVRDLEIIPDDLDGVEVSGYRDRHIGNYSLFSEIVKSSLKTVEYNLGYKSFDKMFKRLSIFTSIPSIASSFNLKVYTEKGLLLNSESYSIEQVSNDSWSIISSTDYNQSNYIKKGEILAQGRYDLANFDDFYYDLNRIFYQYNFNLTGSKAKTIVIEFEHDYDAPLSVYWFALTFKLKKAK